MFAFPNSVELLRESNSWKSWKTLSLAAVFFLLVASSSIFESPRYSSLRRMTREKETLNVFFIYSDSPVAQKTYKDLNHDTSLHIIMAQTQDQLDYLHQNPCVNNAFQRYQEFVKKDQPHLASELWKFCALSEKGGLYLDIDSPLLVPVEKIRSLGPNVAVQSEYFENTAHGSFLLMDDTKIALDMARLLIETPVQTFLHSPLLLATTLYDKIQNSSSEWHTLQHSCTMNPLSGRKLSLYSKANRIAHRCPSETGYCCQIVDSHQVIMMTRFPIYPIQMIPESLPRPYVMPDENDPVHDELPFISTIIEKIYNRAKDAPKTPNFFDTLLQNNCLPSDLQCSLCLREKKGADCKICKDVCPCYCKTLCKVSVDKKFVAKEVKVLPPRFARDPNRLIPRIVHQTWFEPVSPEKYPNMSRLIESFKLSGWEYKFYDDDSSRVVLKTHFPPEVLQAYDALKPGAFKADLFRYCVLLIYGGVYADMDVLLEANLEAAVGPDVGFMVPVDEPGSPVGKRMCLWNGFIASSPGHPFLARAVETVVNNVRNRFTSVDIDATFCPEPELSILHAFDTLFTAGPCILGSVVNKVLGRHGQTQFEPGEIEGDSSTAIPGRTIILKQNKWDMGAHRFTLVEKNLLVAATDMPDYDDREKLEDVEHYSKTHVKTGIYGLEKLYADNKKANEDIKFLVDQ